MVDQSPLAKTPRSTPAVYLGVYDHIRSLFGDTPAAEAAEKVLVLVDALAREGIAIEHIDLGGGKGIRIVRDEKGLREAFQLASAEAKSAFGDDRVYLEKFVTRPRHVEIQVMADKHGNVVFYGERECSVQRRHQKVIEEAPAPGLSPAQRRARG